jgi:hypothetical protein
VSKHPEHPASMNGDHAALWQLILHVNSRVDRIFIAMIGGQVMIVGVVIGLKVFA